MNRYEYYGNLQKYKSANDEMMHYGIMGQKWGIRHWQNPDGTFNEEGKIRYFGKGQDKTDKSEDPKMGLSLTTVLVADAVLWGTILTADGITAAVTNKKIKKYEEHLATEKIDKKTGLRLKDHLNKKGQEMTEEEEFKDDLKKVNMERSYGIFLSNRKQGYTQNCMTCTTAMDLRQRGYDVRSGKTPDGFEADELKKWYRNPKIEKATFNDTISNLKKQPEGAYGNLMVVWANSYGAGHSMFYKIQNGEPKVYCAQTNDWMSINQLEFMTDPRISWSCRTDNLTPNYKYLKENNLIRY